MSITDEVTGPITRVQPDRSQIYGIDRSRLLRQENGNLKPKGAVVDHKMTERDEETSVLIL